MSHHGNSPQDRKILGNLFDAQKKHNEDFEDELNSFRNLGPTGKFPQGHLNDNDDGEIKIAIGEENGKVIIDFGKPTAWIGFTKEQAIEIGELLIKRAKGNNV